MSEIKVTDMSGNPLQIGNFVEYVNTGTKGNVTEIISDNEGTWALIDKTDLYYKTEVLRRITVVKDEEIGEKIFSREEINEVLEKQKEASKLAEMSDTSLESGG
ncbi:MAG: DUF2098 domain-containing protein [Candidatus Methanoperedens sp.]|nr:DUF2098 domain-containing protein [Candidatus Methanoperedens sp.]